MVLLKKIIALFVSIVSLFSFFVSFNKYDIDQYNKMINLESSISYPFIIPKHEELSNPETIYNIIYDTAKTLNINIYRSEISLNQDSDYEIDKYVLFTSKSNYYTNISISGDTFTSDNMSKFGDKFLSSIETSDSNQIGLINDFGNNNDIFIRPLLLSYNKYPSYGKYYVELPEDIQFKQFLNALKENINNETDITLDIEDFLSDDSESDINIASNIIFTIANIFTIIVSILIIIYIILRNSKKISVYKLNGISDYKIFNTLILSPLVLSFICITILMLFICFITKIPNDFYIYMLKQQAFYCFLFSTLSFLPYLFIVKNSLNLNLKNKSNNTILISVNMILKFALTVSIIFISSSILTNYISIQDNISILNNWNNSKNFGVFYPYSSGSNFDEKDSVNTNIIASSDLYTILNEMGSIFIDASKYVEYDNYKLEDYKGINSIIVNNNYLQDFPIYDLNHEPVNIPESESDWILLVPNKYKSNESEIINFFGDLRSKAYEWELEAFSGYVPDTVINQDLKIIWIEDDQDIFTFDPRVNIKNNNILQNEIIEVITLKNSVPGDHWGILGGGNTDPLKVKLINNSIDETYNTLLPKLKELHLDDNFSYLISSNDLVTKDIHKLKYNLYTLVIVLVALLSCFFIIAIQNIIIFFNSKKQEIITRRIFGLGFFETYKGFITMFTLIWIVQSIVSIYSIRVFNITIILICIGLAIVEFIASLICILFIENKNKVNILKGD